MRSPSSSVAIPLSVIRTGKAGKRGGTPDAVGDRLWPVLRCPSGSEAPTDRPEPVLRGRSASGCRLDADEVVALGGPQEGVLEDLLGHVPRDLAAFVGHDLRHRQGEADREAPRARAERVDGEAVGTHHRLVDGEVAGQRSSLTPGGYSPTV